MRRLILWFLVLGIAFAGIAAYAEEDFLTVKPGSRQQHVLERMEEVKEIDAGKYQTQTSILNRIANTLDRILIELQKKD